MKRVISITVLFLLLAATLAGISACVPIRQRVEGNGVRTSLTLDAKEVFDLFRVKELNVTDKGRLDIRVINGGTEGVTLSASSNVMDEILLRSSMSDGEIYLSGGENKMFADKIEIVVSGLSLSRVKLWGKMGFEFETAAQSVEIELAGDISARIDCAGLTSKLSVQCAGDTDLEIYGNLAELKIQCGGDTDVTMETNADSVEVEAAGDSDFNLVSANSDFVAQSFKIRAAGDTDFAGLSFAASAVEVKSSGKGRFSVNATSTLDVDLSGDNRVRYAGNPLITQQLSGQSTIEPLARQFVN